MARRGQGIKLSPGDPILLELSHQFTTEEEVIALATYVLAKVGQGGRTFFDSLQKQSIALKCQAVLEEWVKKKPEEAFGKTLWSVLSMESVKPIAATRFKDRLLGKS